MKATGTYVLTKGNSTKIQQSFRSFDKISHTALSYATGPMQTLHLLLTLSSPPAFSWKKLTCGDAGFFGP